MVWKVSVFIFIFSFVRILKYLVNFYFVSVVVSVSVASSMQPTCFGDLGALSLSATGGSGDYEFSVHPLPTIIDFPLLCKTKTRTENRNLRTK